MSDSTDAIGERIRLTANDVPTQNLRQVVIWLEEIQAKIIGELGAGHPMVNDVGQMIGARVAEVDQLIASFSQLQADIEGMGDRVAGRG
jgi:hypothetical protein